MLNGKKKKREKSISFRLWCWKAVVVSLWACSPSNSRLLLYSGGLIKPVHITRFIPVVNISLVTPVKKHVNSHNLNFGLWISCLQYFYVYSLTELVNEVLLVSFLSLAIFLLYLYLDKAWIVKYCQPLFYFPDPHLSPHKLISLVTWKVVISVCNSKSSTRRKWNKVSFFEERDIAECKTNHHLDTDY